MNYGCEDSGNQATILKGPCGFNRDLSVGCDKYQHVALEPLIYGEEFYVFMV
jgi:hypothetical protein